MVVSNNEQDAMDVGTGSVPAGVATSADRPEAVGSGRSSKVPVVIIALATALAIVSTFSVWAKTQLLDTDEWVDLSSRLVEQPEVQSAVANYLVEQVYADGAVSEGLEEVLPDDLSGLAGPLAGVIRRPLTDSVELLLASDRFQELWATTNRVAHETLVSVLRGENAAGLSTNSGEVTLDLRPLVVATGETIGLSSERLDAIPEDAGRIVIFESDQLDSAQQVVQLFDFLAWFLFVLVVVLYAAAVYLARGSRLNALRNVGLSIFGVGVVVLAVQALAVRALINVVADDPAARPVANSTLTVGSALLRQQGWSALIYGLVIAGFAILLGSRPRAVAVRRRMSPAFTASTGAVVGGTVVGLLLLIWWSPGRAFSGWTTGLVLIGLVVGAVVALRAQMLREQKELEVQGEPVAP